MNKIVRTSLTAIMLSASSLTTTQAGLLDGISNMFSSKPQTLRAQCPLSLEYDKEKVKMFDVLGFLIWSPAFQKKSEQKKEPIYDKNQDLDHKGIIEKLKNVVKADISMGIFGPAFTEESKKILAYLEKLNNKEQEAFITESLNKYILGNFSYSPFLSKFEMNIKRAIPNLIERLGNHPSAEFWKKLLAVAQTMSKEDIAVSEDKRHFLEAIFFFEEQQKSANK